MTMKDEVRCSMCDKVFASQASKDRHLYRCPAERKVPCPRRVRCKTAGDMWRRLRCGRVQKDGGHVLCVRCANRRAHVAAHAKLSKRVRTSPGIDPKNTLPRSDGPKGRATPAAPQGARAVDGPLNPAPRPLDAPPRTRVDVMLGPRGQFKRENPGRYRSRDGLWVLTNAFQGKYWLIAAPSLGLYSGPVATLADAKMRVCEMTFHLRQWFVAKHR